MSLRNVRKLHPETVMLPPEDSDGDFEPLYAKSSQNKYNWLEQGPAAISDPNESSPALNSEPDDILQQNKKKKKKQKKRALKQSTETCTEETPELQETTPVESEGSDPPSDVNSEPEEIIVQRKKNKKKKKHRKVKLTSISHSKETSEVDTVEQFSQEPNNVPGNASDTQPQDTVQTLSFMVVEQKHLNSEIERTRKFGPISPEQGGSSRIVKRSRQAIINRLLNRKAIVPLAEYAPSFHKVGLTMSVERRENGYVYYTFDHDESYQLMHRSFLMMQQTAASVARHFEVAQENLHVEGLINCADILFMAENYTMGISFVEKAIAYMQYISHPKFSLTDQSTRLEYKYRENRPFHVAVLKYLHILTNRACHRTALEMAKALLNLDPSDPLAVLLVIDMLALRAREHQWLVDAVSHWYKTRQAGYLFNIQYSYAMAQFHVCIKNGDDVSKADKLLQKAIIRFPSVVTKILECASVNPGERLKTHPLFANDKNTNKLKELIIFYAKFTWSKWREPPVLEWLKKNANALADKYDNDVETKERVEELINQRLNLFQWWPEEVSRHICVINPMSQLLLDGAVPSVGISRSADPLPPKNTIDRYYKTQVNPGQSPEGERAPSLLDLLTALLGFDVREP